MKNIIFITFFIGCRLLQAQDDNSLYLISGHPYENTDERFESVLWKYNPDSLNKILILSTKKDFLEYIKYYPDHNLVIGYKTNFLGDFASDNRLFIVDSNNPTNLDEINIGHKSYGLITSHLVEKTNKKYIALYLFGPDKEGPRSFIGIDLEGKSIDEISTDNFGYSVLVGEPGGEVDGGDYIVVYSNEENGELEIPYGDKDKRAKFPYVLPPEYEFKSKARHLAAINNKKIFVVDGEKYHKSTELGWRQLLIYNKETNEWIPLRIKGNLPRIKGFGEWIVGNVCNEQLDNQPLPGSDIWKDKKTGLSPQIRFSIYAPGILFIYNASTKAYFEIDTNQADSEILLIKDHIIYYRAYDKLYKIPIIDNTELGKPILLIQNESIPDVHWAFISK